MFSRRVRRIGAAFLASCALILLTFPAAGGESEDSFVAAYKSIQEGDQLALQGQQANARACYEVAFEALERLRTKEPDWNPEVVAYRLKYLERKLGVVSASAGPARDDDRVRMLEARVRTLESEKELLGAKLQEALAARPASVDPAELKAAQDTVRAQQKEIALLTVRLNMVEAGKAPALSKGEAEALRSGLAKARRELEVAQRSNLTNAAALRALEASLAASRSEGQALLAENRALKERVSQQDLPVQDAPSTSGQVAELTRERDELRKRYDAVLAELLRIRMANHLEGTDALTNQLAVLKAKLEAVEAQAEPYSAEELALLRLGRRGSKAPQGDQGSMPATDLEAAVVMVQGRPSPSSQRDPVPAPTNGGSEVQSGVTNVMELSRNAARQLGAGDLTAAAVTLAKALKAAPRDPVCLRLKGRLALLEERDSEALDCLSLSAQIDSQDAETFRLLGLALSRRGLPQPAEAALRRALRLAPQYGVAHHDLAVVYLAQTPPAVDLARWHYRKALEAGEATDPDLEKLMDAPSAGGGAP